MANIGEIQEFSENVQVAQTGPAEQGLNGLMKKYGVAIAVILVVVIGGAVWVYFNNKAQEEAKLEATKEISRALQSFEMADYKKALQGFSDAQNGSQKILGFKAIADKYDNVETGYLAALYAGNCYINIEQTSMAKRYFEKAKSSDNKVTLMGAHSGLAAALEEEGKYAEAAENYVKASEMTDQEVLLSKWYVFAAVCYEQAKDKEKASDYYTKGYKKAKFSEYGIAAKQGMLRLGIKID